MRAQGGAEVRWPGYDASLYRKSVYYVAKTLESQKFESIVGVVILLNSITIGVEAQLIVTNNMTPEYEAYFFMLETFFLIVYSIELSLRFYAYGVACLKSGWV